MCSLFVNAQKFVGSLPLKFESKSNCFEIIDDEKKQLALCINQAKKTQIIRLSPEFKVQDSMHMSRPDGDFKYLSGYSVQNGIYYLYWNSSGKEKSIGCQIYDFNTKKNSFVSIPFELTKERVLTKINKQGKFYVISCIKGKSILNFRIFDGATVTQKQLDLTEKSFLNYEGTRVSLSDLLSEETRLQPAFQVQKISDEMPPSLVLGAKSRKVYVDGEDFIFTFDNYDAATQVFKINTTDFNVKQYLLPQKFVVKPISDTYYPLPASSFYINKKIIQLKSDVASLHITVRPLEGEIIKHFEIKLDQEIDFKNTEIIQENGSIKNTRILDKSNQLIQKINNLYPAITCYNQNNLIVLTVGGVSDIKDGAGYGAMFGLIGIAIEWALSNYSNDNYNSYIDRKVVYISGLFDENFNSIKEPLQKPAFDKLREFTADKKIEQSILFKFGNSLYMGGLMVGTEGYSIYQFND